MNYPYAFTFVIGYRHRLDRLSNLRRTLDWINGFSSAEVLLVEQDTHSKIKNLNLKARHIFVKSNMPYNRSWAFNVALKYAKSPIVIFGDSDLIMNPNDFIEGLKALQEYEMVSPYSSVIDLNAQESTQDLNQILQINRPGRGDNDNQKINIAGGISIFRKDAIMKIGGWLESYTGWGCEDNDMEILIRNFLTFTELKSKCYHLYHTRDNMDQKLYQFNLQLLNNRMKMTKEQLGKSIQHNSTVIGMLNKYDK
jgi:predicted glycosyltransferase involved in capsule biosynthesis